MQKTIKNTMEIKFKAIVENEAFARNVVASFILPLNPSLSELEDIKTAVNAFNVDVFNAISSIKCTIVNF